MEYQTQPQPPAKGNLAKIILIVIGAILIIIIFGALIYFNNYLSKIMKEQSGQKGEVTKNEEPPKPKITLPKVLYNLAGPIEELQKNSLVLLAEIPQLNEAGQLFPKTESRKVLITPTTKFSHLIFVAQEGTNQKTPKETVITFKDLKLKDYIEVVSNRDISQAPEFEATQIRLLPQ